MRHQAQKHAISGRFSVGNRALHRRLFQPHVLPKYVCMCDLTAVIRQMFSHLLQYYYQTPWPMEAPV